jgi:hypothetical protein
MGSIQNTDMNEKMKFDDFSHRWMCEKVSTPEGAEEFFRFMDNLLEPKFTLKQANIRKQDLSYWKREGLFENRVGAEGREWTRMGFFDYMWLRLVVELRKVNVPVKNIAHLRTQLFEIDDETLKTLINEEVQQMQDGPFPQEMVSAVEMAVKKQPEVFLPLMKKYFSLFARLILGIMLQRRRMLLTFTPEGVFDISFPDDIGESEHLAKYFTFCDQPYMSIPLHRLLDEFYENPHIAPKDCQRIFGLTSSELKIFEAIRQEGNLEVRIKLKPDKGGFLLMETLHQVDPQKSIQSIERIIKKGGYQNIEIKTEHGSIRVFEIVTKEKI